MFEIIVGDGLTLKKITLNDAPDMFEYASDPILTEFLPWEPHKDLEETKMIIEKFFRYDSDNPNFGIFLDGKLIGTCGASIPQKGNVIEVGYALSRKHWGKGIVTKCLKKYIQFVKEKGVKVIMARVLDNNEASIRVIEKCGFVRTEDVIVHSGMSGPKYIYAGESND